MATPTENAIQEIYLGLLGRPADAAGLAYWANDVDVNGMSLAGVRFNIVNEQPEYEDVFGGLSRAQTVNQLYLNLFNRDAEAEGLDYWVNGGGSTVPVDLLVFALSDGAGGPDRLVLDNKIAVANYITDSASYGTLSSEEVADILSTVGPSNVAAVKAAYDAAVVEALDPTGEEYVLTGGLDNQDGTGKNDIFRAQDGDLETGDNLDGLGGDDTLIWSLDGDSDYYFAAPTLNSIETIRITAPNAYDTWIELDLFGASGYETIEFFNITNYDDIDDGNAVSVYDVQNVNDTNFRFIDTDIANYDISYDTNAYITPNGGDDDIAELYFSEVNGSSLWFFNENTGGEDSNVDQVNITSAQRNQINDTTFNYLQDIYFGDDLNTVIIDGDADLEVEDYLDWNVNLVDASELAADLTLDLYAQRLVWNNNNTVNAAATTVLNYTGAQGDDNLDVGGGEDGISVIDLGTGNDDLTVGQIGYYGEDIMLGHTTVIAGEGHDRVEMYITGLQDISGGAGNDTIHVHGDVDDLTTVAANDGVGLIDAGEGDDDVFVGGGEDTYSIGDYAIDLGAGHDNLEMWVHGNPTVVAGAGNDTATINVMSDVTFFGNEGDDELTINGDGVHTIDMGEGDDLVAINGDNVSGPGDFVDYGADTVTTIVTGTGNDSVSVSANHYLDVTLGEGDDQITLRAEDLTSDDVIRGDEEIDTQAGSDTMILTNTNGEMVYVTDSETAGVVGFETFDLRNRNIEFHLTEQMFDTANGDDVTVSTRNANGTALPVLYTAPGVLAAEQFDQGMSRQEYETIRENLLDGVYTSATVNGSPAIWDTDIENFLLKNGVNIIDFVDDDLSDDASQVDTLGENPEVSDDEDEDSVFFQLEPPGEMVIDITEVAFNALNGREFTLLGGNIKDVVVADDASINGRATLEFDDASANNSIEDTLIVQGAATITAADLRNVSGLENIVLKSNSNGGQTWNIDLTDRVINQTTGSAALVITVDPNVPGNSVLNITLDDSVDGATNDVIIQTIAGVEVYINGVLVQEVDYGIPDALNGLHTITVAESLIFTDGLDSLIGQDQFYAHNAGHIQAADSAQGTGEDDWMYVAGAPSNAGATLATQFNNAQLVGIENLAFTDSTFHGAAKGDPTQTGGNVQMTGLGRNANFLLNLETLHTGNGNDNLQAMEGGVSYYLYEGNDVFVGLLGSNPGQSVYGGDGNDQITTSNFADYIDGGEGNDTITSNDGNDIIDAGEGNNSVDGGAGADNITAGSGNDTIIGGDGNDIINAGAGNNNVTGGNGDDNITTGNGNDTIDGGAGNDVINAGDGNNTVTGDAGDDTVTTGSGNDSITTGVGDDRVTAGAGNDTIDVGSNDDWVDAGAGDDLIIFSDMGELDTVNGGAGIDTVRIGNNGVTNDQDFEDNSNVEVLVLTGNAASVTGAAEFEEAGYHTVIKNVAGNKLLDFSAVSNAVKGDGTNGAADGTTGLTITITNVGGADGNHTILGSMGDDTITGGDGADVITGGTGADLILLGTGGSDTVVFSRGDDGALTGVDTGGWDIIRGFNPANDQVQIDGLLEAALVEGGWTSETNNFSLDTSPGATTELAAYTGTGLTNGDLTDLDTMMTYLNNFLAQSDVGDDMLYLVQGTSNTALYYYVENAGDNIIDSSEIRILGVFEDALLTAADVGV
ncbi:MAG: DUF4214 domain-containing protein [Porticoccaceae bacterium]|nr:DUF4214 domain-containing protein [Porticoccaceae bacterium]